MGNVGEHRVLDKEGSCYMPSMSLRSVLVLDADELGQLNHIPHLPTTPSLTRGTGLDPNRRNINTKMERA
jgi:hypothetical protein